MKHLFFISLIFIGCQSKSINEKFMDLKVGMTYNEVEDELGKPKAMEKGIETVELRQFRNVKKYGIPDSIMRSPSYLSESPSQSKSGILSYNTWYYDFSTKIDTYFTTTFQKGKIIFDKYAVYYRWRVIFDSQSNRLLISGLSENFFVKL